MEDFRPVAPQDLRVGGAVEGLEDRSVVVQLREWRLELDEEIVVDARVADVVAESGDEEDEGGEGVEDC